MCKLPGIGTGGGSAVSLITNEMLGRKLDTLLGNGFIYEENLYPRPLSFANNSILDYFHPIDILSAAPIYFPIEEGGICHYNLANLPDTFKVSNWRNS